MTAPVTSRGPSGIGFFNFGDLNGLGIRAVRTGARGFSLYDATLHDRSFASIAAHADGAIGIQVNRPLPRLAITGDAGASTS
ncbi:MAG TPA: hypothetical protein VF951_17025 [Streptosporangiaceae bacterium]